MSGLRHRLARTQTLPRPPEEIFSFLTDPRNLERLAPPFLGFRNLSPPPAIELGTVLEHRLFLFGYPIRWRTRIEEFEPGVRFVDRQIAGPYRYWRHLHVLRAVPEGTEMADRVEYELPFGLLGEVAHGFFVRRILNRVFDYRRAVLAKRFAAG